MELYQGLISRRSVRRWKEDNIDNELVKKIIKAAMFAPSSHNLRNWEFVVITEQDKKDKLSEVQPFVKILKKAPVLVVVCGTTGPSKEAEAFWVQNCSAATQNMLLAAHSEGLGGVWCAVHPMPEAEKAVREILSLPENVNPLGICAFGYPERDTNRQPDRYDETKIHYNSF